MSSNLQHLDIMLRAMVVCRSIACFLGYPIQIDPTFTNFKILSSFSGVIDSCAQSNTLWDFNSFDVAAVLSPLLDYAEMIVEAQKNIKSLASNKLKDLKVLDIQLMQENLTFLGAFLVAEEIDSLRRTHSHEDSWTKWFGFIRYTKSIQMEGLPEWCPGPHTGDVMWIPAIRTYGIAFLMMHAMQDRIASQNFFAACCSLQDYTLGFRDFKHSFDKFSHTVPHQAPPKDTKAHGIQYKTAHQHKEDTEAERAAQRTRNSTWPNATSNSISSIRSNYLQYPRWAMSSNHTMFTPRAISAKMAELIEGSIAEPNGWNRYNGGRF